MSDQVSQTEFQFGAVGMIVVNDLAIAAGVASIPGPGTDLDDDGWFVWEPFQLVGEAKDGGADGSAQEWAGWSFDSKAMRRIEEGFGIAIVCENVNTSNGLEIALAASFLTSRI